MSTVIEGAETGVAGSVPTVAVLFARADSIYKSIPGCDVWDIERDARTWPGGAPVIAHPPCRAWGRLRGLAKPRPDEKELARFAVRQVRANGGVLEHPNASTLWPDMGLPPPDGSRDQFGGYTIGIHQSWFGHRAEKPTLIYVVGVEPGGLPAMALSLGYATHVVSSSMFRKGHPRWRPECKKAEREHTPPALASWLVDVARRTIRCQ